MRWNLLLERVTRNKLNPDITRKKIKRIAKAAERNKSYGFRGFPGRLREPEEFNKDGQDWYKYKIRIRVEKPNARNPDAAENQFQNIYRVIERCAEQARWKVIPNVVEETTANATDTQTSITNVDFGNVGELMSNRPRFVVPELNTDVLAKYFTGVYNRDSLIRLIHDSVRNHFDTLYKFENNASIEIARSHVLLKGKPAGCKSTIFERFKTWYDTGSPVERVFFVDGPQMTKAGLDNYILDMAADGQLPEILVIEEIEKQNLDNLLILISLMGSGNASKLNARVGFRKEMANCIIWATCNEPSVIQKFRNGVLWSRFAHRWHCKRPDRALMRRILLRRIESVGGNPVWADKALEYAYETVKGITKKVLDDPREVLGLLDGRDRLIDGTYQKDLIEMLQAELDEQEEEKNEQE